MRILRDIPKREISGGGGPHEAMSYAQLLDLSKVVEAHGSSSVHVAIRELLLRLLETSLLHDRSLQTLMRRWNALSGQAHDIVRDRLRELCTVATPPEEVVDYLVKLLGGTAARLGRRTSDYGQYLPSIFEQAAACHPRAELRCTSCGYHFRAEDLGAERRNLAKAAGLMFSREWRPERKENRDPWKPLFTPGRDSRKTFYTQLTIDHIVPEEGLGSSEPDNLAVMCNFCNAGKMAYRRPLEPLSLFAAGGVSDFPPGREMNRLMHVIVVSSFSLYGGRCTVCGAQGGDGELTVRPSKRGGHEALAGLAPWNLSSLCYDCLSDY